MEFRTYATNADRLRTFLADRSLVATVEDQTADGLLVVTDNPAVQLALSEYADQYIPDSVRLHLKHLRDYAAKDPTAITNAESIHAIKDLIRTIHYLNSQFESEG